MTIPKAVTATPVVGETSEDNTTWHIVTTRNTFIQSVFEERTSRNPELAENALPHKGNDICSSSRHAGGGKKQTYSFSFVKAVVLLFVLYNLFNLNLSGVKMPLPNLSASEGYSGVLSSGLEADSTANLTHRPLRRYRYGVKRPDDILIAHTEAFYQRSTWQDRFCSHAISVCCHLSMSPATRFALQLCDPRNTEHDFYCLLDSLFVIFNHPVTSPTRSTIGDSTVLFNLSWLQVLSLLSKEFRYCKMRSTHQSTLTSALVLFNGAKSKLLSWIKQSTYLATPCRVRKREEPHSHVYDIRQPMDQIKSPTSSQALTHYRLAHFAFHGHAGLATALKKRIYSRPLPTLHHFFEPHKPRYLLEKYDATRMDAIQSTSSNYINLFSPSKPEPSITLLEQIDHTGTTPYAFSLLVISYRKPLHLKYVVIRTITPINPNGNLDALPIYWPVNNANILLQLNNHNTILLTSERPTGPSRPQLSPDESRGTLNCSSKPSKPPPKPQPAIPKGGGPINHSPKPSIPPPRPIPAPPKGGGPINVPSSPPKFRLVQIQTSRFLIHEAVDTLRLGSKKMIKFLNSACTM